MAIIQQHSPSPQVAEWMGRREAWSADRSSDSRTKPTRWEFRGRRHANKALAAAAATTGGSTHHGHDNRGNTIGDDDDDGSGGGGGVGIDGHGAGRLVEKKTMTDGGGSGKTKDQTVKIRLVHALRPPARIGVATGGSRLVVVRY